MEGRRPSAALAISNFLRQHDLVQVQWVFLSSGLVVRNTPARHRKPSQSSASVQVPSSSSEPLVFDGVLVIVGGGAVDADLLRHMRERGGHLVGADGGADQIAAFRARHPEWAVLPIAAAAGRPRGDGLRLTPAHDGTDGFFVARLTRP